jgi:hypothetical protein
MSLLDLDKLLHQKIGACGCGGDLFLTLYFSSNLPNAACKECNKESYVTPTNDGSLCKHCHCMTHIVGAGYCEKCGRLK